MNLETPRLILRRWRAEDRDAFFAINCEPAVLRFLPPISRADSDGFVDRINAHFAENGWGYWAMEEKRSGALIGMCGLAHVRWQAFFTPAVEIGWRLATQWQGKGLAREGAERALAYAFEDLRLTRIVSFTVPANTPSWGLMVRLGMHKVGEFDHPRLAQSHPLSRHVLDEVLRHEWRG